MSGKTLFLNKLLIITCFLLASFSSQAQVTRLTTPDQNGIAITTVLDTDNHQLTYEFNFTNLPYNYQNFVFNPSPLPAFSVIPLEEDAVYSLDSEEWNFQPVSDNNGTFNNWALELQYMFSVAPSRINSIVINYNPSIILTGALIREAMDENLQVTYRRPVAGFPAGQDENIKLWAYVPELQTAVLPNPTALWIFGLVLAGACLLGFMTFVRLHNA